MHLGIIRLGLLDLLKNTKFIYHLTPPKYWIEKEENAVLLMDKLKPLPSTLREKRRYIAFEIIADKKLDAKSVLREIYKKVEEFIGQLNMAKAGIILIDGKENKGIISANNRVVDQVVSALALVNKLDNQKVIVNTLGVSGILKKAKEKYF